MAVEVVMPRLSDSMEEGTIVRWSVADGEEIEAGAELVEIETDKATMTYEAEVDGTLRILAREGKTVPVGAPIATIGDAARDTVPLTAGASAQPAATAAATEPVRAAAVRTAAAPANGASPRPKASPLARRVAAAADVDLTTLVGSGARGRIVRRDVEAAMAGLAASPAVEVALAPAATAPAPAPAPAAEPATPPPGAKGALTTQELTRTQQVIARRMAEAKATIPEFTVTTDVDMTKAVALRDELKGIGDDITPSYNDLVVKAAAWALRRHPRANGSYRDGTFVLHDRVNVGVAVAAQGSLLVPTVFDADTRTLGSVARDTRRLAARARDAQLTPPELAGGTFTVSNLGMLGVTHFTAVINAPQAAILAVGALAQRPVIRDGVVRAAHCLTLTLTCDHRILYGADAAAFLADIRTALEAPLRLAF